ncbi:MAG: acyltransferase family protein [Ruminococcus sp.]|nr:acyltransferase family protein [Ruminococcus sp.]
MGKAKVYFDRTETNCIKGVMLIFMFILHFFCYQSYFCEKVSYPQLAFMEQYIGHLQICIAGFAFLTGYFYYYTKSKTYKYSLNKIFDLYIPYWVVLLFLLAIALITGTYSFSFPGSLLEVFAVSSEIMCFCWYIIFYVLLMLALPITIKLFSKNMVVLFIVSLLVPMVIYYGVSYFTSAEVIISLLGKFQIYYPIAIIGYVSSRVDLFSRIDSILKNKIIIIFMSFVLVIVVFMQPSWLYSFGHDNIILQMIRKIIRIFSIPFFIYGLINIFRIFDNKKWLTVFDKIGKYSMTMWFVHCMFFNCSKEILQPVLYLPRYPVLVVIWGLSLCFILSVPLQMLSGVLRKKIKTFRTQ